MSMLPSDTPRLPKWPFLVGDAALLGTAALIATRSLDPWSGAPLIASVSCVALGTVLAAIPFLTDYARKQDIALDDRQRALEELARTVATAAEQIGIAAQGLHTIAELAQKNLKQAEQLPHKLQDKVAELQQQLTVANDEEKEELERDLAALRTSESERLEAVVDKIQKAAGEWTKIQTAATSQLTIELVQGVETMRLVNFMGQTVLNTQVKGQLQQTLNIENLRAGAYTLQFVNTNGETFNKTVIINR